MKNIGIFIGNFNPIHLGHTSFLKNIKKEYSLDTIFLIPIENKNEENLNHIPIKEKRELCQLAIKNLEFIKLYPENFKENEDTLKFLNDIKNKEKDCNLFLVVGPFSLAELEKNNDIEKILKLAKVITLVPLKLFEKLTKKFESFIIKPSRLKPIQSRKLRILIAQKKEFSTYLNNNVFEQIKKHKLFFGKESLFLECYDICRQNTSKKRFSHCNFVAKAAAELAAIYGEDEMDARIAGLMHDLMKEKTKEYMQNIFNSYNFKLNDAQKINPKVWHGIVGALYLENVLEIDNKKIINAVKYHTVPRKHMSNFEKIIFMADRISQDRKYKDVQFLRDLSKKNIDDAVLYSLKNTISSLIKKESTISTPTIECYNTLILKKTENLKENENKWID